LTTPDESFGPFVSKVNLNSYSTIADLLRVCNSEYATFIGLVDDSPVVLYTGQDVYEEENDNHDLKFIERLRIDSTIFPEDLLTLILSFLDGTRVQSFSRVSKGWNKMINQNDGLWNEIWKNKSIGKDPMAVYEIGQ
jgi:hypothetical protein